MKLFSTERGFTLLEMLIVISIIGIIALFGLPAYEQVAPNLALSSVSKDISTDLRYAQQLAVTEQVIYSIIFNTVNNSYQIVNSSSGQTLQTKNVDRRITIEQITGLASDTVNFTPTGAVTESGQIILKNTSNKRVTIEVKPSGYVAITQ